jgi:hypothetical protein
MNPNCGKVRSVTPAEGQIVFVEGGIVQFRKGVFYTGMELPKYARPIQWDVEWWLPMYASAIQEAVRKWGTCSICRRPIINGKGHDHPCE